MDSLYRQPSPYQKRLQAQAAMRRIARELREFLAMRDISEDDPDAKSLLADIAILEEEACHLGNRLVV